jgi:hypothetical protein
MAAKGIEALLRSRVPRCSDNIQYNGLHLLCCWLPRGLHKALL